MPGSVACLACWKASVCNTGGHRRFGCGNGNSGTLRQRRHSAQVLRIPSTKSSSEIITIMKNFNRRSSHGHQGSKRRELAQHATLTWVARIHSHTLHQHSYNDHGCGKCQLSYYFSVHAGFFLVPKSTECYRDVNLILCWVFRVSVIHRAWTTTGSLQCVRDHSCACAYTRGVGHTDSESA